MRRQRLSIFTTSLGLMALLALTSCAGASQGGSPSTSTSSSPAAVADDQLVEFTQCLRKNGVDVEDPKPGEELKDIASGLDDSERNEFRKASQKCKKYLPDELTEQTPEPDALLAWAKCMRKNGVDVPDPKNGEPDLTGVDRGSPEFQKAMETCGDKLEPSGSSS